MDFQKYQQAADYIKSKISAQPRVGIILGSGLGNLADEIANPTVIPYSEIPNFAHSTAIGHKGNFISGTLGGVPVVAMQGRFHYYEGYPMEVVTLPVRVMKLLGIEILIVSFSGLVFGVHLALYAAVSLFLTSRIVDMLQEGVASSRLFFIISPRAEKIAQRILTELERGVTELAGRGVYSGSQTNVLFSVVAKQEVHAVKQIIHDEDPNAFVVLTVANETMGEGFSRLLPK